MNDNRNSWIKSKIIMMVCVMAVSIVMFACSAFAAPSVDQEISLIQPNGESFMAKIVGDVQWGLVQCTDCVYNMNKL